MVLPDQLFIWNTTVEEIGQEELRQYIIKPRMVDIPYFHQEEEILKPWVNPMRLKRIHRIWYKDEKRVVMGSLTAK